MLIAVNDKIIVKVIKQGKSVGGVILPDTDNGRNLAEVISAGPGRVYESGKRVPVCVNKGDKIYFRYADDEVEVEGEKYLIITETSVLGVVK